MVIDAVHPVAVVEKHRHFAVPVHDESVKPPIQSRRKSRIFLVEVNQIGRPGHVEHVSSCLKTLDRTRLRELLARKNESDVS